MTTDLIGVIGEAYPNRTLTAVSTRRYAYATSCALTEVRARFAGGEVAQLILKDFARDHMLADARSSRPRFLDDPTREIVTYERILRPEGIGPRYVGAICDRTLPRHWLICERSPGVELWQIGDIEVWQAVTRWTAAFHRSFAHRTDSALAANRSLFRHDRRWFTMWAERAAESLAASADPRARELLTRLDAYGTVVDRLTTLPATLVHGELYPSNVLVVARGEGTEVCPVDWEMAAIGPAMIDLAALVSGWDAASAASLLSAYGALPGSLADLDRCRLHLALQWLGWSAGWRPPHGQARDWLGEALELARMVLP